MAKTSAPATAATQDDDLPQTAVKPTRKELYIQSLQNQLSGDEPPAPAPQEPTSEEETFKKRYGDLRRHSQQKEAALQKLIHEKEQQIAQLSAAADQPMPRTKEEFEAWKAKYPDIAQFIEIIADEKASQKAGQLQSEIGTLKEKLTETEKEKAFATLKSLVPDLEDILASAEYKSWFANQPIFVQEELNTTEDPYKISYYMGIFKVFTNKPSKTKQDKLAALDTSVRNTGATPSKTTAGHKYTQSQISKMSPQEYEAKEADIIAARNAGQILDDVTKRNTIFDF